MKLGQIIKQYRSNNKLSLRDFAAQCGTSHSYIAMLEDGKNSKTGEPIIPTITTLKKIATALNMPLNTLLSLSDDMPVILGDVLSDISNDTNTPSPELSKAEISLLSLFRRIPEDRQSMILDMIETALSHLN